MKIRIGYGGPRQYPHGQFRPGGRRANGGMTEIERLIHLIASMQILFGSRRGGLLVPLLLIGLCVGGWYAYRNFMSPESKLERAHAMFNSSDSNEERKAIGIYKELLNRSDPIEPGRNWLRTDRDTLYRRIIQHELLNAENELRAAEWSIKAIEDGFTKLRFQNERVKAFWEKTLDSFRLNKRGGSGQAKTSGADDRPDPDEESTDDKPTDDDDRGNKFDNLPGIDDVRGRCLVSPGFLVA